MRYKKGQVVRASLDRVIKIEGFGDKNDHRIFHGTCIQEPDRSGTYVGSTIGLKVWDYVCNIEGVI